MTKGKEPESAPKVKEGMKIDLNASVMETVERLSREAEEIEQQVVDLSLKADAKKAEMWKVIGAAHPELDGWQARLSAPDEEKETGWQIELLNEGVRKTI